MVPFYKLGTPASVDVMSHTCDVTRVPWIHDPMQRSKKVRGHSTRVVRCHKFPICAFFDTEIENAVIADRPCQFSERSSLTFPMETSWMRNGIGNFPSRCCSMSEENVSYSSMSFLTHPLAEDDLFHTILYNSCLYQSSTPRSPSAICSWHDTSWITWVFVLHWVGTSTTEMSPTLEVPLRIVSYISVGIWP